MSIFLCYYSILLAKKETDTTAGNAEAGARLRTMLCLLGRESAQREGREVRVLSLKSVAQLVFLDLFRKAEYRKMGAVLLFTSGG